MCYICCCCVVAIVAIVAIVVVLATPCVCLFHGRTHTNT